MVWPVLFLALTMTVWAQTGSRYALVIGNGNYSNVGKLANPENDARDVAAALQRLGYQVDLRINLAYLPMIDAVDAYTAKLSARPQNEGFFWFAGHGIQIRDENYLLPVDVTVTSESRVQGTSYSLNRLLGAFDEAHNKVNIVIVDACRNNPLPATTRRSSTRGLAVINDVPADLFVMFSTAPGETAIDGQGKRNSPFAEAFLKNIESKEGLLYMAADVMRDTATLTENMQQPFFRGSIVSEKYYSLNRGGTPQAQAAPPAPRPAPQWGEEVIETGNLTVSTITAGTLEIRQGSEVIGSRSISAGARLPINNLAVGTYTVRIRYSGGRTEEKTITVKKDGTVAAAFDYQAPAVASGPTVSPPLAVTPQQTPASRPPERPVSDGFVRINGGTFMMGSPASEVGRDSDEVQHQVTVSSFYMGKYEVTQKEYAALMGTNPSNFKGDNLPVEKVSWFNAVEYCNARSRKEGLTPAYTVSGTNVTWNRSANGYRLPTEAEWEYACRAGTTTPYSSGSSVDAAGWYWNNSGRKTHPVGTKQANAWGLYDLHGNVWEWCWDWYGGYSSGSQTDPVGASSGTNRVVRGGSWDYDGQNLRSALRNNDTPSIRYNFLGFRLARPGL
jgi:formylglycine-generating enzyme required for sulfatase activity